MSNKMKRIWELDTLRGLAILMVIAFHTIFNLEIFFGFKNFNHESGFWFYEGRIAAILFILLVGVASSLVQHRYTYNKASKKNAYRGLRLIGLGLIVTISSYLFDSNNTIWFGILHFMGLSILISIPLARYKKLNLLLATTLLLTYYQTSKIYTTSYLGIIFGILPPSFQSYDHYALIPWMGFILIGIALGNWFYPNDKPIVKRRQYAFEKWLATIGKYSLLIYLIHQPIILGIMWLIL